MLIGLALKDPRFDVLGVMVVMLPALAWELGKIVIADPDILL
jgi:hypothetical protein